MNKHKIILCIAVMLIVAGCQNLRQGKDPGASVYTGFNGVKAEFLKNTPPPRVFEDSSFPVVLRVRNSGTFSLEKKDSNDHYGILALGVEEDYNSIDSLEQSTDRIFSFVDKNKNAIKSHAGFYLDGKSIINPKGDEEILSYTVRTLKLDPQSEKRTSTIMATLCYPYQTTLSTTVCIDTDIAGIRQAKKSCAIKPLAFGSGQGAPVAITGIETRMIPAGTNKDGIDMVRPEFIIEIENMGDGEVIRNDRIAEMCSEEVAPSIRNIAYNVISLKAYLSGTDENNLLDCFPKPEDVGDNSAYVRLIKKKDFVRCVVNDQNFVNKGIDAYSAPLNIIMDYGYTSTITSNYAIEKQVIR
ncbi:hypothetical protein HYU10_05305 [Candidatus Woesearchaeota archaeon]|nr:hypothetical protein [Candidatus Woesearchaeota archaeon]